MLNNKYLPINSILLIFACFIMIIINLKLVTSSSLAAAPPPRPLQAKNRLMTQTKIKPNSPLTNNFPSFLFNNDKLENDLPLNIKQQNAMKGNDQNSVLSDNDPVEHPIRGGSFFADSNSHIDNNNEADDYEQSEEEEESFFELANRRMAEVERMNRLKLEQSIAQCPYSPLSLPGEEEPAEEMSPSQNCVVGSLDFDDYFVRTSDRLFAYDANILGLVSSQESYIQFFQFNFGQKSLTTLKTKYFKHEIPHDACADKHKNVFVIFPDSNRIRKYIFNHGSKKTTSNNSINFLFLKEVGNIRDFEYNPTTISCADDFIYVGERMSNFVRVYDKNLKKIKVIHLNGVVVSNHRALAVNQHVRVMMDGSDALGIFPTSSSATQLADRFRKKYTRSLTSSSNTLNTYNLNNINSNNNNQTSVCHFHRSMSCLEDVKVSTNVNNNESKHQQHKSASIYAVDSCTNEILHFHYQRDERIRLKSRIQVGQRVGGGSYAISVAPAAQNGLLFVLTDVPRKILILNTRECKL